MANKKVSELISTPAVDRDNDLFLVTQDRQLASPSEPSELTSRGMPASVVSKIVIDDWDADLPSPALPTTPIIRAVFQGAPVEYEAYGTTIKDGQVYHNDGATLTPFGSDPVVDWDADRTITAPSVTVNLGLDYNSTTGVVTHNDVFSTLLGDETVPNGPDDLFGPGSGLTGRISAAVLSKNVSLDDALKIQVSHDSFLNGSSSVVGHGVVWLSDNLVTGIDQADILTKIKDFYFNSLGVPGYPNPLPANSAGFGYTAFEPLAGAAVMGLMIGSSGSSQYSGNAFAGPTTGGIPADFVYKSTIGSDGTTLGMVTDCTDNATPTPVFDQLYHNHPHTGIVNDISSWTDSGSSYAAGPHTNIATTGGSGIGLTVDITTGGGGFPESIDSITINNPGSGYLPGDTITIVSGTGTFTSTGGSPFDDVTFTLEAAFADDYLTAFPSGKFNLVLITTHLVSNGATALPVGAVAGDGFTFNSLPTDTAVTYVPNANPSAGGFASRASVHGGSQAVYDTYINDDGDLEGALTITIPALPNDQIIRAISDDSPTTLPYDYYGATITNGEVYYNTGTSLTQLSNADAIAELTAHTVAADAEFAAIKNQVDFNISSALSYSPTTGVQGDTVINSGIAVCFPQAELNAVTLPPIVYDGTNPLDKRFVEVYNSSDTYLLRVYADAADEILASNNFVDLTPHQRARFLVEFDSIGSPADYRWFPEHWGDHEHGVIKLTGLGGETIVNYSDLVKSYWDNNSETLLYNSIRELVVLCDFPSGNIKVNLNKTLATTDRRLLEKIVFHDYKNTMGTYGLVLSPSLGITINNAGGDVTYNTKGSKIALYLNPDIATEYNSYDILTRQQFEDGVGGSIDNLTINNDLTVNGTFTVDGVTSPNILINDIKDDSTFSNPSNAALVTESAIKKYVAQAVAPWQSTVLTSGPTYVSENKSYWVDSSGGSFTINLPQGLGAFPQSREHGDRIVIKDLTGNCEQFPVTIQAWVSPFPQGLEGELAGSYVMDVNNMCIELTWPDESVTGSVYGWQITRLIKG